MKPVTTVLGIGMVWVLALSACAAPIPPTATPTLIPTAVPTAVPPDPTLKTAVGDLVVASARLVDEVNGAKAAAGEKILLVILAQPGQATLSPDTFSLEAFQTALQDVSNGQVHLSTETSAEIVCSMAGWVEKEFAMGFRVPETAKRYTLVWPGNAPLALTPAE